MIQNQKIIQQLELLYKKTNRYANLSLLFGIATNISPFVLYKDTGKCLAVFGIGIIITVIIGRHSSKYRKQYRQIYKDVFVKEILAEKLEDVHYDWKKGFTGPEIYNSQLFTYKEHISDDYLKASYKNIKFEQADVKHSSNGKINFRGKIMKLSGLSVNVSGIWIYTKNFNYNARYTNKSLKRMSLRDREFDDVFDLYVLNEATAERILAPQVRKNLLTLASKNTALGMCFKGSRLCVGIHTSRDTFDVDSSAKHIDYKSEVCRLREDVAEIIETIELLMV